MLATESADIEALYERNTWHGPVPERKAAVEPTRHPLAGNKPGVRSTSRKALKTVMLGEDERIVFEVLRMHDRSLCDAELLDYLRKFTDKGERWQINQVNGRGNSLLNKGLIEEHARWHIGVGVFLILINELITSRIFDR